MKILPIDRIKTYFLSLQNAICNGVEQVEDSAVFKADQWQHANGGGGISKVITGNIIEKGGVNFSHVKGEKLNMFRL